MCTVSNASGERVTWGTRQAALLLVLVAMLLASAAASALAALGRPINHLGSDRDMRAIIFAGGGSTAVVRLEERSDPFSPATTSELVAWIPVFVRRF